MSIRNRRNWQPSGRPYLRSVEELAVNGVAHIEFPYVSNSLLLVNRSAANITLYFADPAATDAPAAGYEFLLTDKRDSFALSVSVKECWIKNTDSLLDAGFSIAAELSDLLSSSFTRDVDGPGVGDTL